MTAMYPSPKAGKRGDPSKRAQSGIEKREPSRLASSGNVWAIREAPRPKFFPFTPPMNGMSKGNPSYGVRQFHLPLAGSGSFIVPVIFSLSHPALVTSYARYPVLPRGGTSGAEVMRPLTPSSYGASAFGALSLLTVLCHIRSSIACHRGP